MQKGSKTKNLILGLLAAGSVAFLILGASVWKNRQAFIISITMAAAFIAVFCIRFEKHAKNARDIVILSVITAIAVVSRLAFFMLPQFKPIAAVVILAGAAFGADIGFLCGALSMFITSFALGMGIWVPWQMLGLGLTGFLAGILFKNKTRTTTTFLIALYGFFSVFIIYGGLVDTYMVFSFMHNPTKEAVLATYLAGVPFNAVFAISTFLTLLVLSAPVFRKTDRIKQKYDVVQ